MLDSGIIMMAVDFAGVVEYYIRMLADPFFDCISFTFNVCT
jgi:hypothetical protein